MAFDLKSIYKGRVDRPNRIILYGSEKKGKSTFASKFPNPIFLPIKSEEGIDYIETSKFPIINSLKEFKEALESLCQDHDFETIVIDSISALEPLVWDFICKRDNKENIIKYGYSTGFDIANHEFKEILSALDYLRNERNMEIIIIGHAKVASFNSPTGDNYSKYELDVNKKLSAVLQRWADGIFFVDQKVLTKTVDTGFNAKEKKAVNVNDTSILYTKTNGSFVAGARGRLGELPKEMPLIYENYKQELEKIKEIDF